MDKGFECDRPVASSTYGNRDRSNAIDSALRLGAVPSHVLPRVVAIWPPRLQCGKAQSGSSQLRGCIHSEIHEPSIETIEERPVIRRVPPQTPTLVALQNAKVKRGQTLMPTAPTLQGQGWHEALLVEVRGIEPRSGDANPGLLRAQSAMDFLGLSTRTDT